MLLREKMEIFKSGTAIDADLSLAQEELLDRFPGLKYSSEALRFEKKVSTASPILGQGKAFLGAHSYINSGGYLRADGGGVFIGRYCSIGRRVTLGAGAHNMSVLSTSPALRGIAATPYTAEQYAQTHLPNRKNPLLIESDVWIGDGAVIMSGLNVGIGSVIAANAVVTRDVQPYRIVGGVPAREIGRRFPDELSSRLIESQWWECEKETLDTLPLSNIFEFLERFKRAEAHFQTVRSI